MPPCNPQELPYWHSVPEMNLIKSMTVIFTQQSAQSLLPPISVCLDLRVPFVRNNSISAWLSDAMTGQQVDNPGASDGGPLD